MNTVSDFLQAADETLTRHLDHVSHRAVPPAEMRQTEAAIMEALQGAMRADPNTPAWQALNCLERLVKSPANPARNTVGGNQQAYLTDLGMIRNLVRNARQQGAPAPPAATPPSTDRSQWTLADWQQQDSEGLQHHQQANTQTWQALYKRETGKDYVAPAPLNKPK